MRVLNELVEIHNDRIAGYQYAVKEIDDTTIKPFFIKLIDKSLWFREELAEVIKKLGGKAGEGTATSGKIYRIWMDVKAAICTRERKKILAACYHAEDFHVKAYEEALCLSDDFASDTQYLLKKQYAIMKHEYDKVKNLRNALS